MLPLISAYHQIQSNSISDQSGHNPSRAELRFLYILVQEYEQVIKQSSIFSVENKSLQLAPVYERMILYLLYTNGYTDMTSYKWQFDPDVYTCKNHRKLEKIIRERDRSRMALSSKTEAERKRLEKSLEGKSRDEYTELWNQAEEKFRPLREKASEEIGDRAVQKILKLMIRKKDDREKLAKTLKLEEEHRRQPPS